MLIGRRTLVPFLFLLILGISPKPSQAGPNFVVTFDAQYSRVLTHATDLGHWNGLGGSLFLEFQPADFLSLGAVGNFTPYFGVSTTTGDPSFSAYVDGAIRLMPFGVTGRVSPYLLGTFGLNPLSSISSVPGWKGNFHGQAGLGFRWFADTHTAMDFGLTYQMFTPQADPLQTASAHVGLSFFVDPVPVVLNRKVFRPVPRYDSLQAIAGRVYGDPDLYPILIDANFKSLAKPLDWKIGMNLVIPKPLTPEMIREAKAKARDPQYVRASDTFHDPMMSQEFRTMNRDKGSSWVPITTTKRSKIAFHADSLWDIAARSDVYGDPELYPLLVDANRKRLEKDYPGKGFNLYIPRPKGEAIKQARLKAWSIEYGLWRGKDVTPKDYLEWKQTHGTWK